MTDEYPTPGLHDDMPEADYHGHKGSLSHSGLKTLLRYSPAEYRWQQAQKTYKATFEFGSAAHKLVLGVGDPIEVIKADDWRTTAAKEARDAARAAGSVPLLEKDWRVVRDMADSLSGHTLAMQMLSEGRPEVSAFAVDEETGVLRRSRFDWLGTSLAVDYKTCVDERPKVLGGRYGTVRKYGYDTQAAFYSDVAADLGHPLDEFAFIFQRKTEPYPVAVVTLTPASLDRARDEIREGLRMFRDCTESGIWPGTQNATTYHVIDTDNPTPMEASL
jgi:hypothetical protein